MILNDLITSEAIGAYFEEAYSPENTIARRLFPIQRKVGIELAWIKGTKGITPSLAPSAFDTKATLRSRDGITITKTQMPYFKEGIRFSEEDRQNLLLLGENSPLADDIIARYYDDAAELIRGANAVTDRMVFQLLFPENGLPAISFTSNGATYSYTYGDAAWTAGHYTALTGNGLWTAEATADPISDITTVKTNARMKYGSVIRYLIMNSYTLGLMGKTAAVRNMFVNLYGNAASTMALLDTQVIDVVARATGCYIIVDDDFYLDENGAMQKFVPDGYVSFIPDGALGNMFRATTPAEADLMGKADVDVSVVDSGISIAVSTTVDPVNVNTIAAQIALPSFERIDSCALLKVIA